MFQTGVEHGLTVRTDIHHRDCHSCLSGAGTGRLFVVLSCTQAINLKNKTTFHIYLLSVLECYKCSQQKLTLFSFFSAG